MKRLLGILLALVMLAALCACGGGSEPADAHYIYFQNDCGAKMDGFYMSPTGSDNWGGKLNLASVSTGGSIQIDVAALPSGAGAIYDIGAIDENGMNYDFYEIPVDEGDILAISPADGEDAILTVTDTDGDYMVYFGAAYYDEGE